VYHLESNWKNYTNLDDKPEVMSARNSFLNRPELKEFRKDLRNNSTSAEIAMWRILKNKNIEGRKFRRQYSIGNFIVDFCCPGEKLVIELDGNAHADYNKIEKDKVRDNYIIENGFVILRFENKLVFQDPEYIVDQIKKEFKTP
jgi:very-short-patch-repair endonuclease